MIVSEYTLAATRDTIRILSWLKSTAPQARVIVVANKVPAGAAEIGRKDFETSIERKVDVQLACDVKLANQAAKLGKPLAEIGKTGKVGLALGEIVTRLVATIDEGADGKAVASRSLLGKLGEFKVKLPRRKKAG